MAAEYRTPGVYIEEKNAFPSSVVAVQTAVPAFIGYTQRAERNGKSLTRVPQKVTSFAEYTEIFGEGYNHAFNIVEATGSANDVFRMDGKDYAVLPTKQFLLYNSIRLFYQNGGADCFIVSVGDYSGDVKANELNSEVVWKALEREFEPTLIVIPDAATFYLSQMKTSPDNPDYTDFYGIYTAVLAHCAKMQSRFGLFDVLPNLIDDDAIADFRTGIGANFLNYGAAYYPWLRTAIVQSAEISFLNLAVAAGGPDPIVEKKKTELKTAAKEKSDKDKADLDKKVKAEKDADKIAKLNADADKVAAADTDALNAAISALEAPGKRAPSTPDDRILSVLEGLLKKEAVAMGVIANQKVDNSNKKQFYADLADTDKANTRAAYIQASVAHLQKNDKDRKADEAGQNALKKLTGSEPAWAKMAAFPDDVTIINAYNAQVNMNFHQALMASSSTYVSIMSEIRAQINKLPPSGAMAGIYTMVDNSRGVWKAPANVSVNMVSAPTSNITQEQQASYNVDPMTGKSINIIRPFRGIGTMVWGARTLDGNSQDWRYINVRRTLIMIEQSIKLSMRAYVFEPNTASTWITVQSMISNFLTNMWKQGALAGSAPEQAYEVQIGLGTTMTPNDILDGKMLVTIKVAITRPAEFIILTFQQMQQTS